MSEIITDKLTGKTSAGDVTITSEGGSATMQLQQGLVKSWIQLDGTGTIAIQDSFNVSSITDVDTGRYKTNYNNSMSNTLYCVTSGDYNYGVGWDSALTTSSCNTARGNNSFTRVDVAQVYLAVSGDLA